MPKTAWIVGLAVFGILLLGAIWLRKQQNKDQRQSIGLQSWTAYVKGQGIVLFSFLILGAAVASGFVYLGPVRSEEPETGGVLLEPRRVVLDQQRPIYTKRLGRVDRYRRITILTRTITESQANAASGDADEKPAGAVQTDSAGIATITVHRTLGQGVNDEIRRIESTSEAWTRWEEDRPKGELSLIIEPGTGSPARTFVELIIYFTPR
jgi:hypothetical protein